MCVCVCALWKRKEKREIDRHITKKRKRERGEERQRIAERKRKSEREICRKIHLRDPRTLFVVPLSKDEALEAFAQTAAS